MSGALQFVFDDNIEKLMDGEFQFMSNPSLAASFGFHYKHYLPNNKFIDLGLSVINIGKLIFTKDSESGEYVFNLSDIPIQPL